MFLLLHKTLKGSRNIQGFALIRAVLYVFVLKIISLAKFSWKVDVVSCKRL